ncbi:kinase-like domain-containing protein [Ochromonadaceae sp. CCMP2298]|nr:kinase-like domain-containing protein [Ochromonadaceae sp. CCMP2298]
MGGFVRAKTWLEKKEVVRSQSPFGQLPGWDLRSFIVKEGDDLRKEVLAVQLLRFCQRVFQLEGLDIFLKPYQILNTGYRAGLVEFLEGAQSVDRIKKTLPRGASLKQFFELTFGESYSFIHAKAAQNFARSLVGYSLFTYLVQVKDRHNANILIDEVRASESEKQSV